MRLSEKLITLADRALQSQKGAGVPAIRITREILKVLNHVAGQPICNAAELERRRQELLRPIPPPPSAFRK